MVQLSRSVINLGDPFWPTLWISTGPPAVRIMRLPFSKFVFTLGQCAFEPNEPELNDSCGLGCGRDQLGYSRLRPTRHIPE